MPTIIPTSPDQIADIARRLLDVADRPDDVVTNTAGAVVSFSVPDDVAERAGFVGTNTVPEPVQEPEPVIVEVPPRSGKGSSETVWQAFLTAQGIEFPADAERGDLIARWDTHKEG